MAWVLVFMACWAALPLAAQTTAAPASSAAPITPDTVIYPKSASTAPAAAPVAKDEPGYLGPLWMVVLVTSTGAAWWWWKQRRFQGAGGMGGGAMRKLSIEETRPLGNRQYLVVATYEDQRYLLGVTQGQIALLTALPSAKDKT